MSERERPYLYGLVAEFDDPESLIDAVEKTRAAGYRDLRAHTPFWVKGLGDALALRSTLPLHWFVLGAMVLGAGAAFVMQYYTDVLSYPLNVGGRPLNSVPAFLVVCFELAVLFGAFAAAGGLLASNGLPLPYHPIFNAPNFELVSGERFYLCIETRDAQFDLPGTTAFLYSLNPISVSEAKC
jgi:hypothetical protein